MKIYSLGKSKSTERIQLLMKRRRTKKKKNPVKTVVTVVTLNHQIHQILVQAAQMIPAVIQIRMMIRNQLHLRVNSQQKKRRRDPHHKARAAPLHLVQAQNQLTARNQLFQVLNLSHLRWSFKLKVSRFPKSMRSYSQMTTKKHPNKEDGNG